MEGCFRERPSHAAMGSTAHGAVPAAGQEAAGGFQRPLSPAGLDQGSGWVLSSALPGEHSEGRAAGSGDPTVTWQSSSVPSARQQGWDSAPFPSGLCEGQMKHRPRLPCSGHLAPATRQATSCELRGQTSAHPSLTFN